ncbi:MAG: hypothetical protein JWP18_84 [Solirubrobacterales bacterium]|nr:hypothetical protein [Solirubrobacterales bacterium]
MDVVAEEAVFPTMFVAASLLRVAGTERICSRAADFAQRHMEPAGVWRYLTGADPFRDSLAVDVDDTALASLLLRECGRDVPRNQRLLMSNAIATGSSSRGSRPRAAGSLTLAAARIGEQANRCSDAGIEASARSAAEVNVSSRMSWRKPVAISQGTGSTSATSAPTRRA